MTTEEHMGLEHQLGQMGDRWTFVAVLPDSSFVHTVHSSARTVEEATHFVQQIKTHSDGQAPLFVSDSWFYREALEQVYSTMVPVPYSGKGRPPHPKRVVDPQLKYAQVHKKRDKKGRITSVSTRIILGDELELLRCLEKATYCRRITTDYVESRNGKYRKDNARLIRKTLCHSKKHIYHDAAIEFVTQVMNYTRPVDKYKELINPTAQKFEQKYRQRTPAMMENLIDRVLTVKELLCIRPILRN